MLATRVLHELRGHQGRPCGPARHYRSGKGLQRSRPVFHLRRCYALLYGDESGESNKEGSFFFYGGFSVSEEAALDLRSAVRRALSRADWEDPSMPLKFDTNEPRPEGIDFKAHTALKQEVIRLAGEHECRLFCVIILNEIATDACKRREFQINTVLDNFNADLASRNETGLAILDTFTAARRLRDIVKERYSEGLR